jgi:hypothetical protein
MRKIGKYVWAFLAMLAVVIVSGFATLGSVCHTGESMTYFAGKSAVFRVAEGGQATIESVYVNVGTVYEPVGENCKIEIEYTNSSTPSASGIDFADPFYLGNVYNTVGADGYNYNWYTVATGKNVQAKYLFFKADSNLELREIVALDTKGNVIALEPYSGSKETATAERAKAVDAQGLSAEWLQSASTRYDFTQNEAITMSAIHTLTAEKYNGFTYLANGDFGILSTAILSVPVSLFGGSTFALRLIPFLAGIACVAIAFLWAKELFKSEKYAFYTSLLFVLGGVVTTVSRVGGAYAMVAAALLASGYFMYQFFAKGISANHPFRSGLNVALSGVFATLAIVMETLAAVPVVAILVLFGFGVRRIFLSEKLALEKAKEESGEEMEEGTSSVLTKDQVRMIYGYKKRVAFGLAFLTFVAVPFLAILGVGVVFYKPLVLIYDNVGDHTKSLISLVFANLFDACRADYAGGITAASSANVFAWLLPLNTTALYEGKNVFWGVALNAGVSCLSLAAFVFVSYKVAYGFVQKTQDKFALRVRRIYFILLATMAATMIAAGAKGMPTMLSATVFSMAYAAFLPLTAATVEECSCEKAKLASNLVLWISTAAAVVFFALNVVTYYGIPV